MAVVRTNPLPPGLYWLDTWGPTLSSPNTKDTRSPFQAWVRANIGRVAVRDAQDFPEPLFGGPARTWVKFEVLAAPGAFPFSIGFPSLFVTGDTGQTAELPETPDPLSAIKQAAEWAEDIGLLFLLYTFSQKRR